MAKVFLIGLAVLFPSTLAQQGLTCPLSLLIPFHDEGGLWWAENPSVIETPSMLTDEDLERDGIALLAVALMAVEDFNRRESSLVPKVSNYQECQIFFPSSLVLMDTGRNPDRVRQTKGLWLKDSSCAVVGSLDNRVAETVATELVGSIVPAISFGATAPRLTNGYDFPNLFVGNVDWSDTVLKLGRYLRAQRRDVVAIMYTPGDNLDLDDFSNDQPEDCAPDWQTVAYDSQLSITISLVWKRSREEFAERLNVLKGSGVKTIVVALDKDDNIDVLAEVADAHGMLSSEYLWIFMDSFMSPQHLYRIRAPAESPVGRLLEVSRIFQLLDGLVPLTQGNETVSANITEVSGRFQEEWQSRGAGIVDRLNAVLYESNGMLQGTNVSVDEEFFAEQSPSYGSGYLYDAIMSIGMSSCDGVSPLNFVHQGPSGIYRYLNRSLDMGSLTFGVFDVRREDDGSYQAVIRDITYSGDWETIPPVEAESNDRYLDTWAFVLSFFCGAFAICFSMGCGIFVYFNKKNRIVSVAQPEFLYMACFGAMILAVGCFFMGFDENSGWDQERLDRKCVTMTWCYYIGALTVYMALFSKLWRVQRVTQMRRRQKIEVKHVIAPFIGIIVVEIVLLFAYTFTMPPVWVRDALLTGATDGRCEPQAWFDIPMNLLLVVAVAISVWQAWKTRTLPEDISDAKRVWQTLIAHLILLFVGIIFIALAYWTESGTFLFLSDLLVPFLLSVTSVAFLLVPKIYFVYRFKKTGEFPTGLQRGRTRITGVSLPSGTGPSSHITFNNAANASSMVSSGLSGTSALSSTSQSEYTNGTLGRFGSFRLSRTSQNRSARDFSGLSPKSNTPSPRKRSFQKPDSDGSLRQKFSGVPNAFVVNHTGIPSPPISMSTSAEPLSPMNEMDTDNTLSNESPSNPHDYITGYIPVPPMMSDFSSEVDSGRVPSTVSEVELDADQTVTTPLPNEQTETQGTNKAVTDRGTMSQNHAKPSMDREAAKRAELEAKLTKSLQGNIELSTETVAA